MYIIPGAKLARKANISSALAAALGPSANPAALAACNKLQILRAAIHDPPVTTEVLKKLQRYLVAVEYVQSKVSATNNLSEALLWVNGFAADSVTEARDLGLDRLSVVYSMGVACAHLGVSSAFKGDEASLKAAIVRFREAAGYFALACTLPRPSAPLTEDLSVNGLRALVQAMVGNAQQTLVEVVSLTMPGKKGYAAMVAKGAAECYGNAVRECEDEGMRGGAVDKVIGECCRGLRVYFEVMSLSLQAGMYHDLNDVGSEITQLDVSRRAAENGVRIVGRMQDEGMFRWIGRLKEELKGKMDRLVADVRRRKEVAEEYNRRMVLATPVNSVPDVVARVVTTEKGVRGDLDLCKMEVEGMLVGLSS